MAVAQIFDDVLDVEQVAELLRCEPVTVERMARAGELPGTKFGRSWVFVRSLVIEAVRDRIVGATAKPEPEASPAKQVWPLKAARKTRGTARHNLDVSSLPPLPGANS